MMNDYRHVKVRPRIHWQGPRYCYPANPAPERYVWTTDPHLVTCGKCRRTREWKAAAS